MAKFEERKTQLLELIADYFHRLFNQASVESDAPATPETPPAVTTSNTEKENPETPSKAGNGQVKKLTARSRKTIFNLTRKMRENGDGWEKIARAVAAKGYPHSIRKRSMAGRYGKKSVWKDGGLVTDPNPSCISR